MKGQITIDFMLSMGAALVIFILLLDATFNQETQARELMQEADARNLMEDLAVNIDSVYLSGGNSSRVYTLPETLSGGVSYTLSVYPRSILLGYENGGQKYYSTRILAESINGTSFVSLAPGKIRITNVDYTIYFENE